METIGRSGRHRLHWLSLNGDSAVGPQNRTRNDPIRVNSCPFVVFYCMDTAKQLEAAPPPRGGASAIEGQVTRTYQRLPAPTRTCRAATGGTAGLDQRDRETTGTSNSE